MMELKKILQRVNYHSYDDLDEIQVYNISSNSKQIQVGSLFIAIPGNTFDGNQFIEEAIKNGACAIISSTKNKTYPVPYIEVENSRKAMSKISFNFYKKMNSQMNIVGITGTNGKTSICQIISHILNECNKANCTIGTLGITNKYGILKTNFTTPESNHIHHYLNTMVRNNIDNAIIEVSSHALDLNRVDDIEFNIGIFSNLTPEHLDFHKTMDSYFQSKLKLFKNLKSNNSAIINIDDKYSKSIIDKTQSKIIRYSLKQKTDIFVTKYECTINGISASLNIFGKEYKINCHLLGEYNLLNLMASIGACIALKIPTQRIIDSVNKLQSIPGRLEKVKTKSNKIVYIDYAHTPDAYEKVLSTIKSFSNYKIITLFGCGGERDASNRSKMASIAERYSNFVFITSDNPRNEKLEKIISEIIKGFANNLYKINTNREKAIQEAICMMTDDHILLVLGKGRENYEIIKNKKLYHNDIEIIKNYA